MIGSCFRGGGREAKVTPASRYCTGGRELTHSNSMPGKSISVKEKHVAIKLKKAGVPFKKIRDQLKISERSLEATSGP